MNDKKKEAALEAILFAMGDSVELKKLADAVGETPERTQELLERMRERWDKEGRGVTLISLEGAWQMCTRAEYYDCLIRIAKAPHKYALSDTLMETLSIVAYKQPVTRLDVEKIRGVNCDHAINKLVEYGLVEEIGSRDARCCLARRSSFCAASASGLWRSFRSFPHCRWRNLRSRRSRKWCLPFRDKRHSLLIR